MKYNVESRKDIRTVLNRNINSVITPLDFTKHVLAGNYLSQLVEKNIVERVGRGKYKVLKKFGSKKRNPPVKPTREEKFNVTTRAEIREVLNKNVGTIITTQDFTRPSFISNYLYKLIETGTVEKIGFGKYQVLKKIYLKKKGSKRGGPNWFHKKLRKDLSTIPEILNSSEDGLVLVQIEDMYRQITPPDKQVVRNYLYRLTAYGLNQGILKHNGNNPLMRTNIRGPIPKRIVLVNKDITPDQWAKFVEDYRAFYQGKQTPKDTSELTRGQIKSKIGEVILSENFDLDKRYPYGFNETVVKEFNITTHYARKLTRQIRVENNGKLHANINPVIKPVYDILLDYQQIRPNPIWQYKASQISKYILRDVIPLGGVAMYIGTQSPLTVCTNHNSKELYDDDLAIANILDLVTDYSVKPFMVIGNAENAEKSEYKHQIWKSLITTKFFPTVIGKVTKETLYQYISWFANKNQDRLCKVVIGHGGAWDSKNNPYAFKDPCEQLVNKYSNLHIISKKLRFGKLFDVLHLHNRKTNHYQVKKGGIVKCEMCDNNESSYAVEYKDDFHITEICEECLDKDQEKFKLIFDFT